jgi:hypothetical protein
MQTFARDYNTGGAEEVSWLAALVVHVPLHAIQNRTT